MCESVENCCRICLDVESEHVSIIEDATIHLHIKSCLAMTVSADDYLPKDVCVSCASQLSDFYSFKLNAMFSLEWLESCVQEKSKKSESKSQPVQVVQPLPDSEYNSDSLLEFLNNTANIDEYLNNLGKEDIPSIVNMLDRNNENSMEAVNKAAKALRTPTPKKKEVSSKVTSFKLNMEVDALDSDIEIVNEILRKEAEAGPKKINKIDNQPISGKNIAQIATPSITNSVKNIAKVPTPSLSIASKIQPVVASKTQPALKASPNKIQIKSSNTQSNLVKIQPKSNNLKSSKVSKCFACKQTCDDMQKLSQHLSTCELAQRTCIQCCKLFDSRLKMLNHSLIHNTGGKTNKCKCGKQFCSKEKLIQHHKTCQFDYTIMLNCVYRCKKCQQTFTDRFKLYKHAKKHILMIEKKICNICGHYFIGDADFMKHRKKIHGEVSDSGVLYRCKVCSHTSPSHQELYSHVQTHLLKEVEPDQNLCDTCGQCFKTRQLLLRHSLTHNTVVKKERDELCHGDTNKSEIKVENTCNIVEKGKEIETNKTKLSSDFNGKNEINGKLNEVKQNVTRNLFDVKSSLKNRNLTVKIPNRQSSKRNDVKISNGKTPYSRMLTKSDKICNENLKNGKDLTEMKSNSKVTMCEKCGQNVDMCHLDHHFCV